MASLQYHAASAFVRKDEHQTSRTFSEERNSVIIKQMFIFMYLLLEN